MPARRFCVHCQKEIEELNGEQIHKDTQLFVCNPKSNPEHQTVATRRI